jgi:hypothetical protein
MDGWQSPGLVPVYINKSSSLFLSFQMQMRRPVFFGFFFRLGAYYISSRGHAEHAFAPLRSRTHTTHCWQPPAVCCCLLSVVPPQEQEDQEGDQEPPHPHNTERLPLST